MRSAKRLERLRSRLAEEGRDAIAVMNTRNVAYITGFDGVFDEEMAHVAIITPEKQLLLTDSRYAEACARAAAEEGLWEVRLADGVDEQLVSEIPGGVVLEESVPFGRLKRLLDEMPGAVTAGGWVERLREVKEAEEIERIAAAQDLTDLAFDHVLSIVRVGMTEKELALKLEFFMREQGSEGVAFDPIVASGPNSALPHAKVTDRELRRGDFLKLDFGARVGGYCADMTRTIVLGKADDWQREVYSATLAANLAGTAAVRAGVTGAEVDTVARERLADSGLAEKFTHGLGHGVGLEVHERPGVNRRNDKPLQQGAVITIEPGVYEPGRGGVRIEDLVVVESDAARVLTRSTKDLIEL